MIKTSDIEYTFDGMFYALFPVSKGGEYVWNHVLERTGSAKLLAQDWPSFKLQIKAAGYSMRKAPKIKMNDDELLAQLES